MVTQSFDHLAAYITVRILVEKPPDVVHGTGFLYQADIALSDGSTRSKLLLVSNKHVLLQGTGKMTLAFNRKREDGTPNYGARRIFAFEGFTGPYTGHSDEEVDLACVDVSSITYSDAYIRNIGKEFLTPIDYEKVALGSDVLFVGYPNDFYDEVNNLPLVRKGTLASMPNIDFNGKGHIAIDAQVFAGSSGSPVFVDWDYKYRLIGVISGTMEGKLPSGEPALLGIGIIVKQRHVQELVDQVVRDAKRTWEIAPRETRS